MAMTKQKKEGEEILAGQIQYYQQQASIYAKELAQTYKKEEKLSKLLKEKVADVNEAYKQSLIYAKELNELYQSEKENSKLLDQAYQKIKKSYLDTVFLLSKAAEFRDEETGEHIKRIGHYSVAIARVMGLTSTELDTILYASQMHDIGKIGIPDYILFKPGKHTPEEWEVMKSHTLIGGKILSGSDEPLLGTSREIALTHHERWDGNGYPYRLKGTDIPIMGRITSLADVFDALTNRRPYKPAFSNSKSFEIIGEGVGTQFDPHVCEAFFSVQTEILEIQKRFRDANSVR
ncbi:MAG: HD domain-containing protein [Deltaproteobacteria bacterium]|nr:HD domain-containing protein [Deltaproteobacteria bacterium]